LKERYRLRAGVEAAMSQLGRRTGIRHQTGQGYAGGTFWFDPYSPGSQHYKGGGGLPGRRKAA